MGEEDQDDPHLLCVLVECLKPMEIEASCRGPAVWAGVEDTGIVPVPSGVSSLASQKLGWCWPGSPLLLKETVISCVPRRH